MGGQLAYLYLVGPISMDDGRPMTLPDIPLLGFLTTILMLAGALIMAAILQRKPLPITYVAVNKKPHTKLSQEETGETEKQQYRPIYPGQFSKNTGKAEDFIRSALTGGTLFNSLGFYYIGPIDGYDLDVLLSVLKNAKELDYNGPILIHVKTRNQTK